MTTTPTEIRGVVLDLDTNLKPCQLPSSWGEPTTWMVNGKPGTRRPHCANKDAFFGSIARTSRAELDTKRLRRETLVGNVFHTNYLTYLETCYANHWAPVFTPDILWFTLLNEVATIVRDNAEAVRELFTFSKDKVHITVLTGDPVVLPVNRVVAALKEFVPVGIDQFLPTFTTSTEASYLAFAAAFCDVVSPYYSYGMMMCGFPRIILQGVIEDYVKVTENWRGLPPKLVAAMGGFHSKALSILENVTLHFEGAGRDTDRSRIFWQSIFAAKRCGSGGQTEVSGWFTELLHKGHGDASAYASNFDPHVAKVDYTFHDTGQTFTMLQGVFSSQLGESGVAVPEFGSVVFETTQS